MQYIGVIGIALLLIGLGAVYVLYPLTGSRLKGKDYLPAGSLAEPEGLRRELKVAREERDRIYSGLAELDHDFSAGDLNQEDYHQLRTEYKQQAVETLLDLDRLEARERQVGEEIEQAVAGVLARTRVAKKTRAAGTGPQSSLISRPGKMEALTKTVDETGEEKPLRLGRFCQRCGHEAEMSAVFCSRCGFKLARLED
jgi:hypothetical protein